VIAADRRAAFIVCIALLAFTAVAAIFGQSFGPNELPLLLPIAAAWSLCDLLTAFLFYAQFLVTRRAVFGIVGAAFICSGILTWPYAAIQLDLFGAGLYGIADLQVPVALRLLWHGLFPILVIGAWFYERNGPRLLPRRHVAKTVAALAVGSALASVALAVTVFAFRDRLPVFVIDGAYQAAYSLIAMPLVIIASALAFGLLVARGRAFGELQQWLAVAMFASLLDASLNGASPVALTWAWDAGKVMTLVTASIVLILMLSEIVRMYEQNSRWIASRAHQAAARMRALWQISTSEGLSESDHVQMILDAATANIRSSRSVFGMVTHREGDSVRVDAIARHGDAPELDRAAQRYAAGNLVAFGGDIDAAIHAAGRTVSWIDANDHASPISSVAGLRSVIGTPIQIGAQTHFLIFGLPDELHADPFVESDVAFVDVVASNISHRFYQRSQVERLQFQIEHDTLTALFTRTQFRRLGRAAEANGTLSGIITINLDRFREINERAGQMIGDELLVEIAAALQGVDADDVVARLGGDGFAVLVRNDPGVTLEQRLEAYASIFRAPFYTGDRSGQITLPVSASLGGVKVAGTSLTFEEALARADVALDNAKEHGGARGIVFGPDLETVATQRVLERDAVLAALHNEEFVLEYQPTFRMTTREIAGAEALLRWDHPTRGRLQPFAFLSAVRRANLLTEVTSWIVARIARDFAGVAVPSGFRVYFNAPAHALESETFLLGLEETLAAHPGFADQLGIEITESEAMNRVERAIEALERIRRLGLLVAIDDFGTGYSSLSYLKRLPIDIVKLDKNFIDGIPDGANDVALAEMFLTLTRQFSLISVGEGIETERQAAWLLEHGCMIGQGYLFARPLPLGALLELLNGRAVRP
jgi:diguanylate cyclase (GGDEF)-like protein